MGRNLSDHARKFLGLDRENNQGRTADTGQVVGGCVDAVPGRQTLRIFRVAVGGSDAFRQNLPGADQPFHQGFGHFARPEEGDAVSAQAVGEGSVLEFSFHDSGRNMEWLRL